MNTITPKPKTVVELFEGHPERWTKGAFARDKDGHSTSYMDRTATCFCIRGACGFIYGSTYLPKPDVCLFDLGCDQDWNDAPERTFEEVLSECKELGI